MFLKSRYFWAQSSVPAGHVRVIGPGGDDNPMGVLEDAIIANTGTVDLRIAHTLSGVLGTRYATVKAGTSRALAGRLDNLVVYNPHAATGGSFDIDGVAVEANSGAPYRGGADLPHSPLRTIVARITGVAGQTIYKPVHFFRKVELDSIKLYSVSVPAGADFTLEAKIGATSLVDDDPSVFDLETLVTKTLTPLTLIAIDSRVVPAGQSLEFTYLSSAGGDAVGDLLAEVNYRFLEGLPS